MSYRDDHERIYGADNARVRDVPHGWIQWKGTEVCVDIHCSCGCHSHLDADFAYYVKCPSCKKIWALSPNIPLLEVPEDVDWLNKCDPREAEL